MTSHELKFRISESRNCPLYRVGDIFTVNGMALSPPKGKAGCLYLAKLITDIVAEGLAVRRPGAAAHNKGTGQRILTCNGCSGFVQITALNEEKFHTPLGKVLSRFEKNINSTEPNQSLFNFLKKFSFFRALSDESLKDITDSVIMKQFAEGEIILKEGSQGKAIYIVISGRVVVENVEGNQLNILEEGELFGEMSLLADIPVSATIRAIEPVKVLLLAAADLELCLQRYPFLQAAFTRLLAKRLRETSLRCTGELTGGISGQLSALPISEVLQMLHENGRSGLVEIILPNGRAALRFHKGEINDAFWHNEKGLEAFFQILGEREGSFRYIPEDSAGSAYVGNTIGDFMKILMEGVRRLDEKNAA